MQSEETLKRQFPSCYPSEFASEILPQGLPPQQINVFRVCTTGTICRETFLSTYEEIMLGNKPAPFWWGKRKLTPGSFSVSCNDTLEGAMHPLKCLTRHHPAAFLAYGLATSDFGPMQRTIEREPAYGDATHIDWWLYADADPSPGFKRVEVIGNE